MYTYPSCSVYVYFFNLRSSFVVIYFHYISIAAIYIQYTNIMFTLLSKEFFLIAQLNYNLNNNSNNNYYYNVTRRY